MQKFNKNLVIATFASAILIGLLMFGIFRDKDNYIDYELYKNLLTNNMINRAVMDNNYVTLYSINGQYKIAKELIDTKELYKYTYVDMDNSSDFTGVLIEIIVLSILVFFLVIIIKILKRDRAIQKDKENKDEKIREQLNSIQKKVLERQNQQIEESYQITASLSDVTFKDVAGIKDVKEELEEIIDFLRNPDKYSDFGVKLPKGVLLVGPPGVGKTLIAKAVAGEANVPFFYQSGASFVQIYVGVGAKRVRELFAIAKAKAPSIIFIDEIDAIGKSRGNFRNDERESTLNQLLTEMDGFEESKGVIVIGATNRLEMLDDALLRAGRFDRRIFVSLPTFEERRAILSVYLNNKTHDVDIDTLTKMTVGFNGATISSFVNEAGIYALKNNKEVITIDDFLAVKDKVAFGKKRNISFDENQKNILATYQGAKAIVSYWLDIEFDKVSLISHNFKESDKELLSKTELLNRIKLHLAGISAYDIKYQERYSNVAEDLEKAKALASKMINEYAMGKKILPHQDDIEVILNEALSDNKEFLSRVTYILDEIEELLIDREVLSFDELKSVMNANNF